MIIVENTSDFEFFSRTSKGAMQGYGYQFTSQGTYGYIYSPYYLHKRMKWLTIEDHG